MLRTKKNYLVVGFIIVVIVVNVVMSLVNFATSTNNKPAEFLTSVSLNNIEKTIKLVDSATKDDLDEALVIALNNRDIDMAKLLIKHGADVSKNDLFKQNAIEVLLFSNEPEAVREVLGMLDVKQTSSFINKSIESIIRFQWDYTSSDSTRRKYAEIKKPYIERRFKVSMFLINEVTDTDDLVWVFNSLCKKRAGDIYDRYGYHVMRQIINMVNESSLEMVANCALHGGRLAANIVDAFVESEDDINQPLHMSRYWGRNDAYRHWNKESDIKPTLLRIALTSEIKSFTYHLVTKHAYSDEHVDDLGNIVNLTHENVRHIDDKGRTQLMLTMMMDLGKAEKDDARAHYLDGRVENLKRLGIDPHAVDDQGMRLTDYIDIMTLDGLSKINILGKHFPEYIDAYIQGKLKNKQMAYVEMDELMQIAIVAYRPKIIDAISKRDAGYSTGRTKRGSSKPDTELRKYSPSFRTVTLAERYNKEAFDNLYYIAEERWKEIWSSDRKYKEHYQDKKYTAILSQY